MDARTDGQDMVLAVPLVFIELSCTPACDWAAHIRLACHAARHAIYGKKWEGKSDKLRNNRKLYDNLELPGGG